MRVVRTKYPLSKNNNDLISEFIDDLRIGRNVSVTKGGRSETTLKKNFNRMRAVCSFSEKQFQIKDISKITEEQILTIFERMNKGLIKTIKGTIFNSTESYQATFKAFWRWLMKARRKQGIIIHDITLDFISQKKRPEFTQRY